MEKMLKECAYDSWRPMNGEEYFYVDDVGIIHETLFGNTEWRHIALYKTLNCFKTQEKSKTRSGKGCYLRYCNTVPLKECHYRQLKRKEQECKELKKEKAEIKKYLGISYKTIIQRLEELQECKDELSIREYNYKQALDEIEGIADDYNRAGKTSQYYRDGFDEIQDIIMKVKEDK